MVVLRPAMLGAGAHRDPVPPSYRGTTTGQRSSSAPGPLPHLFGPRGTGIIAGTKQGWEAVLPTVPSFIDSEMWQAWYSGTEPAGPTTGSRRTPGGYKAFEHLWALPQAFALHQGIGRARVAERTHALARQLK